MILSIQGMKRIVIIRFPQYSRFLLQEVEEMKQESSVGRRRVLGALLAAAVTFVSACPAYAGAWTTRSPEGQATGKTYYIGDNGTYVRSAWVFVNDVWYWLQGDGSLPSAYGISSDGYIFNEKGIYVPSITGAAWQYHDQTVNPVSTSAANPTGGGGTLNPIASGWNANSGTAAGSGQVQGVPWSAPSNTEKGPGRSYSGLGYKPSDYGPGAGYVSDPHH